MIFNVDVIAIREATDDELEGGASVVPPNLLH